MSNEILTARKGPVLEITLNRPQIGNAASDAMAVASATGSTAVVAVLPTVTTTAHGTMPSATSRAMASRRRSARIEKASSDSIERTNSRPNPASSAAFSTELWL